MQIKNGANSWSQLRKAFVEAANAVAVTVTPAGVEIVAAPNVTVVVGDVVFCSVSVLMLKGLIAGRSDVIIGKKAGTGAVKFIGALANAVVVEEPHGVSALFSVVGTLMFAVTVSGDLDINLVGTSAGSDSTVAIGDGQIAVTVLRGA